MAVPWVLLATEAIKLGKSMKDSQDAKNQAKVLAANRPYLPDNKFTAEAQGLAASELASQSPGMNAFDESIDRDLSNSLSTILKGGGDVNDVGSLFDGSQQGRQRALMMSDNLRLNKINNYIRTLQGSDASSQQQFQFNQWAPWADKAQANAQARMQSNQNTWNAIGSLGSTAARLGESGEASGNFEGFGVETSGDGSFAQTRSTPSVANQYNYIDPNNMSFRR